MKQWWDYLAALMAGLLEQSDSHSLVEEGQMGKGS